MKTDTEVQLMLRTRTKGKTLGQAATRIPAAPLGCRRAPGAERAARAGTYSRALSG
jgi:hypothetical protein